MTIGIIGHGQFGAFVRDMLAIYAPDVTVRVYSRRTPPDAKAFFSFEEVCQSDAVIVTVAMRFLEETFARIEECARPDTVIVDVATVKEYPVTLLQRIVSRPYLATHPMFGPESYEKVGSLRGLRVVLGQHTLPAGVYEAVTERLSALGLVVIEMDAAEHDKLLAETLFVTHLVGQTLKDMKLTRTSIDTVSFGFLMDAAESVAHDAELFRDVFRYNRFCSNVLSRFHGAVEHVERTFLQG